MLGKSGSVTGRLAHVKEGVTAVQEPCGSPPNSKGLPRTDGRTGATWKGAGEPFPRPGKRVNRIRHRRMPERRRKRDPSSDRRSDKRKSSHIRPAECSATGTVQPYSRSRCTFLFPSRSGSPFAMPFALSSRTVLPSRHSSAQEAGLHPDADGRVPHYRGAAFGAFADSSTPV